jgi:hypothetical protein
MNCPVCGTSTIPQEGCWICMSCGWAACGEKKMVLGIVDEEAQCVIPIRRKKVKKPVNIQQDRVTLFYFDNVN